MNQRLAHLRARIAEQGLMACWSRDQKINIISPVFPAANISTPRC